MLKPGFRVQAKFTREKALFVEYFLREYGTPNVNNVEIPTQNEDGKQEQTETTSETVVTTINETLEDSTKSQEKTENTEGVPVVHPPSVWEYDPYTSES
jgi:hypothetical protein